MTRKICLLSCGVLAVCMLLVVSPAQVSAVGGPVILMGIDAEDGNGQFGSAHGGKTPYISVIDTFLTCVTNGGSGILVIGGGKAANDNVTGFWNAIAAGVSPARTVTYVNGAAAIALQSFAGFEMIAVASSVNQTFSGGLTNAENTAFAAKAAAVAAFVNGGGGLFGLSQQGLTAPQYAYLGTVGAFTFNFPSQFANVTATAAGLLVGITNTNMDVCCWHDQYLTFPAFLTTLAINPSTGEASSVGGCQVIIAPPVVIDIKPRSCPNPLNVKVFGTPQNGMSMKGGVLPVAILGSDILDVTDIDVSSLLLEGVSPIRSKIEDVAAPVPADADSCECTTDGPDGFLDLTLKFKKADVAAAIGPVADGEVKQLCLTGELLDGTPFDACDCVIIRAKGNNPLIAGGNNATLGAAWPNPFNPVTNIGYVLTTETNVTLTIFDVAGRLVERLVDGVQSPGKHSVMWDAKGAASGVYFYRLEAGNVVETRRMILLK